MKLEAIKKENCITEPFEYILIENFIEGLEDPKIFNDYIKDYYIVNEHEEFCSVSEHPVEPGIHNNRFKIIEKVNEMWDLGVKELLISMNMFTKSHHNLPIHNDHHVVETLPVRGILYCNPEKIFGTTIHISDKEEDGYINELGGNPGDLLLIKVSENSWHGTASKRDIDLNRLTCNMFFTTRQDGTF